MAGYERRAAVAWEGDLGGGTGAVSGAASGLKQLTVASASRGDSTGGWTSPEEILAAAHVSSYAMALAGALSDGTPPQRLDVSITFAIEAGEGGPRVARAHLIVMGNAPGLAEPAFAEAVQAALGACPVTGLLRAGGVEVDVEHTLRSYRVRVGLAGSRSA